MLNIQKVIKKSIHLLNKRKFIKNSEKSKNITKTKERETLKKAIKIIMN